MPTLYVVSTPIGNLQDITLRSLDTLKTVDGIVCEDTRVSSVLLSHFGISKPLIFYNDHNASSMRPKILKKLQQHCLALISDAGTPLISDPGYKLIQACHENHIAIVVEPGPSAILPALIYSGFPPYPFWFGGFFDKKFLKELRTLNATCIFFESAQRISKTIDYLMTQNIQRQIAISRELTKKFEETRRGSLEEIKESLIKSPIKGEVTFCLSPPLNHGYQQDDIDRLLQEHMIHMSLKESAQAVSALTGEKINALYKRGLTLR